MPKLVVSEGGAQPERWAEAGRLDIDPDPPTIADSIARVAAVARLVSPAGPPDTVSLDAAADGGEGFVVPDPAATAEEQIILAEEERTRATLLSAIKAAATELPAEERLYLQIIFSATEPRTTARPDVNQGLTQKPPCKDGATERQKSATRQNRLPIRPTRSRPQKRRHANRRRQDGMATHSGDQSVRHCTIVSLITRATSGSIRAVATMTTTMPPIMPTRRLIAGRMSGDGKSPCTIDRIVATPA